MAYNETAVSGSAGNGSYSGQDGSDLAQEQLAQAFSQAARPAAPGNTEVWLAGAADTAGTPDISPEPAAQDQPSLSDLAPQMSGQASVPPQADPNPAAGGAAAGASAMAAAAGPAVGTATRSYDASGALLSTTTTTAGGGEVEVVNDTSGSQAWSSLQNTYDAGGALVAQHVQYRDRHVDDLVIDAASGKVSSSLSTQSDGTRLATTYDLGGSQPWSSTTLQEDASGVVLERDVQLRDGSATQTRFDATGVADKVTTIGAHGGSTVLETNTASQPYGWQNWSTTQGTYDAANVLTDQVAHNLDGSTTTSHYDVAHGDALQFQTTRNADGSSMDIVTDTSDTQTYTAYDVYKDAAGHITSQNVFDRDGSLETTTYTAAGAVQNSTTTNADHSSSVVTENADGSVRIDDYNASGQLADEAVAHADKSVTKTVYQTVNGAAVAEVTYQFNADGSWVENDLDDALAGSPLLVQQVHNANGTETDYVHAPQGGQSYSSYTVQKDATGTVTEEDIQGTDGSYTQDTYAAGKLVKSTRDATDGTYAITYLNTGTQPWAFQTYSFNALGQYTSAVSDYAAAGGKASYWTQDTWTPGTETWTGQSTHYDNGTEYDVVIGGASDSFTFYTVGKDAAGTVRQQTIVNADGSTVVLGSDSAGHIDTRTILPAGGGFDQEVVNASGQTSAIVSHGADGSAIVQAFTTGGAAGTPQTLSYQSISNAQGQQTAALLVGSDGSRTQETYGANGQVLSASVTRADGTLLSAETYASGGAQASTTVVNADGSLTVTSFDASGRAQRVSFEQANGVVGASFVVEAGGGVTAGQAVLNQVTVALEEQILAQPADAKHTVSQRVTLADGELYTVTVDPSGKVVAKHEHPSALLGDIEEAAGIVLNVLAAIPGPDVVAAPLAVAWDTAQAGEDFSQGNVLGGVLSLGSAVGVGVLGAADGAFGQGALQDLETLSGATTAAGLGKIGQGILEVTAAAGGGAGIAQGIRSGDPLAIAAGGFEIVAAGVSGLVTSGQLDPALGSDVSDFTAAKANTLLANEVALGTGLTSVALGSADAAEHGDWIGSFGALLAAAVSSGPALSDAADEVFGTAVVPAQAPGGQDAVPGYQSAAVQPVSQENLAPPQTTASASIVQAGEGAGGSLGQGGAAAGGVGAGLSSGVSPAGGGQAGTGAGWGLAGSQQGGGLSATNAGVTTDASGTVHVDVPSVITVYAPAGGAAGQGTTSSEGTGNNVGDTSSTATPSYPMVTPRPAPDGSGAWTNLSDADYYAFKAGIPAPAISALATSTPASGGPATVLASVSSPAPSAPSSAGIANVAGSTMVAGGGSAVGSDGIVSILSAAGEAVLGFLGTAATTLLLPLTLSGDTNTNQGAGSETPTGSSPNNSPAAPGTSVNTGNQTQMTGTNGAIGRTFSTPIPGQQPPQSTGSPPPTMPDMTSTGLPVDTTASGPSVLSTPAQQPMPGSNIVPGTPIEGPQLPTVFESNSYMPTINGRSFDISVGSWVDQSGQIVSPPVLGSEIISKGTQFSGGNFPTTLQPPNTILYKLDNAGNITNYEVWDNVGLPVYRVDVTGSSHSDIPTPHTIYFSRNPTPSGQTFVNNPFGPYGSQVGELP